MIVPSHVRSLITYPPILNTAKIESLPLHTTHQSIKLPLFLQLNFSKRFNPRFLSLEINGELTL